MEFKRLKYPIIVPVAKEPVKIDLEIPAGILCRIVAYKTKSYSVKLEYQGFHV